MTTVELNLRQQQSAKAVFAKIAISPYSKALDAFRKAATTDFGNGKKLYPYSKSNLEVQSQLRGGPSCRVSFSSDNMTATTNGKTIHGEVGGAYRIFSGGAAYQQTEFDSRFASSKLTIEGEMKNYVTVPIQPNSWYSSSQVIRGLKDKSISTVWNRDSRTGHWDTFFGKDGVLKNVVSALVVVGEFDVTITSDSKYTEEDVKSIESSARFGVWPFFSVSA